MFKLQPLNNVKVSSEMESPNNNINISNSFDKLETASSVNLNEITDSSIKFFSKASRLERRIYGRRSILCETDYFSFSLINSLSRNKRRWSYPRVDKPQHIVFEHIGELDLKKHDYIAKRSSLTDISLFAKEYNPLLSENRITIETKDSDGAFCNSYSPNIWYMNYNYKEDSKLFMSDVVKTQYILASKIGDFENILPSIICRRHIQSKTGGEFLKKYGGKTDFMSKEMKTRTLKEFLDLPSNGRSTKRIVDAFGLVAVDIDTTPYSVYIHVIKAEQR